MLIPQERQAWVESWLSGNCQFDFSLDFDGEDKILIFQFICPVDCLVVVL
jgi:hypothetical protein